MDDGWMQAGAAVADITPPVGAELCGFLARVQPSVEVHDALAARALYLETADARLLWLHADLVGLEQAFVQDLRAELAGRLGLSASEVVVSATHTHSGPATIHLICCGTYDERYVARLRERLLEAAATAVDRREPVRMVRGEGTCDLAVDRRGKPSTHTDPVLGVVGWQRGDGTWLAVQVNYAIHHVALRADNRAISADMAGRAATTVAGALEGQPVVLVTNGACGNLNPPATKSDFIQRGPIVPRFDLMQAWGDQVAEAALAALRSAEEETPILGSTASPFQLRFEPWGNERIGREAERLLADMAGESGYVADRYREAIGQWRALMIERTARGAGEPEATLEVQVVRLGRARFACLAAEVFSLMAEELRRLAGPAVYVVGYANGDAGYLAPSSAYDEGGYEVESAFAFYGGLPARRGEFERLRDHVAAVLAGMRAL